MCSLVSPIQESSIDIEIAGTSTGKSCSARFYRKHRIQRLHGESKIKKGGVIRHSYLSSDQSIVLSKENHLRPTSFFPPSIIIPLQQLVAALDFISICFPHFLIDFL